MTSAALLNRKQFHSRDRRAEKTNTRTQINFAYINKEAIFCPDRARFGTKESNKTFTEKSDVKGNSALGENLYCFVTHLSKFYRNGAKKCTFNFFWYCSRGSRHEIALYMT